MTLPLNTLKDLSPHCSIRLEYFYALVADKEYSTKRAIAGLKAWKFNNLYRLNESDTLEIDHALSLVK